MTKEAIQLTSMQGHKAIASYDYGVAVAWAVEQVRQEKETEHILMLAAFSAPYNSFEVSPYVSAVLAELGLEEFGFEQALIAQAHLYVDRILSGDSPRAQLGVLREMCEQHDHHPVLMEFYSLSYAWGDLVELGVSYHFDGVTKDSFDEVLLLVAQEWVKLYVGGAEFPAEDSLV